MYVLYLMYVITLKKYFIDFVLKIIIKLKILHFDYLLERVLFNALDRNYVTVLENFR